MKYYSLTSPGIKRSFAQAVREGLAPDCGLYFPQSIPQLGGLWSTSRGMQLHEYGAAILGPLIGDEMAESHLLTILDDALSFQIPLVELEQDVLALELFHGPTAAFKDIGARIMARLLGHFSNDRLTVLVATSGDTGSAVAQGFLNVPGIDVVILYPSQRISHIQEQQLTTVGNNVTALEVDGSFDDCQSMVKQAFTDPFLSKKRPLTSANSINIGRWLPQAIYYAWASSQLEGPAHFVVPSGNFGNLAAGVLAHRMGMPARGFVAATNANDGMVKYLESGRFQPRTSLATLSNAMDVGDPSNRSRLEALCENSWPEMTRIIQGAVCDDVATVRAMQMAKSSWNYLSCPHTAIGLHAAIHGRNKGLLDGPTVVLSTAHPAKFGAVVEEATGKASEIPTALQDCLTRTKQSIRIPATYDALSSYLASTAS